MNDSHQAMPDSAYRAIVEWLEADRVAEAAHRARTDAMARSYGATADEMPVTTEASK